MYNEIMEIRLGDFEATVLYAVLHCSGNAYGVSISHSILERTGRDVALGALYATLDRLEKKGYLKSRMSEPKKERGGRRKRLYVLTGAGEKALRAFDERFLRMREGWQPALVGGGLR